MTLIAGLNKGHIKDIEVDADGNLLTSLGTTLAGESIEYQRLLTSEVWDYGEDNYTYADTDPIVIKGAPGVLGVAQVLVADADVVATFYDSDDGTGVVLGIISCATAGTQIYFRRPAGDAISMKFSGGTDPKTAVVAVGTL